MISKTFTSVGGMGQNLCRFWDVSTMNFLLSDSPSWQQFKNADFATFGCLH
jgi:hypothetical protein